MKNTDQSIDQLLQALNATEAPSGLEQRVTARMEQLPHTKSNRTSSASSFLDLLRLPLVPAAAYPVAIVVLAVLGVTTFIAHRKPHIIATLHPPVLAQASVPQPSSVSTPQSHPKVRTAYSEHLSLDVASSETSPASTDPDAIALAEMQAPSHPAPRMPLTRQEYLMLTILRSGDQQEMAALDPMQREALLSRDHAEFQQFFYRPPPPPQPVPSDLDTQPTSSKIHTDPNTSGDSQ